MGSYRIPLVDLRAQYLSIKEEIDEAVARVVEHTAFVLGEEAEGFEVEFGQYCGVKRCVACANGTDALELALESLGVGAGDEVITVAHTFIATAEAISSLGAKPVFVDIRPDTLLMDAAKVEGAITEKTKAIVPVHLYGQMCDMDAILAVAKKHGLRVVEDAAQAHGATWRGRRAGTWGDAASYSFYPGKNLGAFGDAGAVATNNVEAANWMARARNHGRLTKYEHEFPGRNSRMDGIQAAVLRVKLRHLDEWNRARSAVAMAYREALQSAMPEAQVVGEVVEGSAVHHLFVVSVQDREAGLARLRAQGIEAGVHYPVALHQQPAYRALGLQLGALPVTELAAARVLSLPIYPELNEGLCGEVVSVLAGR